MIFAAKIKGQGTTAGTYLVSPLYTRIDGVVAPDIEALPINGLVPATDDIVYCAEGINDFAQSMQLLINENGGAFPIIFASLATSLVYTPDMQLKGKIKLGEGDKKMVLGDPLQTWAQAMDAWALAIDTWARTVLHPPFPGTPALQTWQTTNLSENHKLD
jgi:hypothetical protein